jgi:hypothetical protein
VAAPNKLTATATTAHARRPFAVRTHAAYDEPSATEVILYFRVCAVRPSHGNCNDCTENMYFLQSADRVFLDLIA